MSFPDDKLPDPPPELIADVKAFVRIDHDLDDLAIADLLKSAAGLCENFIGQISVLRELRDILPAKTQWQKLKRLPVSAIGLVEVLGVDGTATTLNAENYAIDVDSDSLGWIRLHNSEDISRIRVTYNAGLSTDWTTLPSSLRQGIVRLAGYFYANRDSVDAGDPPSAVTALWRPYRRMRLT